MAVLVLWYWVGSRMDRRWSITERTPWIALAIFSSICLLGAFLRIGYVGYVPYGLVVWIIAAMTIRRSTRRA
jgi:hypothetical protein